eukprot:TRINITY_DN2826_c0_g2_i4.p1 TRINITY_DN2826_c0_g2~~TRINITY_DN2826_c0_g2_i4.p1  ORF type:complete len:148 (-),score=3.66 TRINITY_DN2826_c0_g2_i4:157-600(-)
MLLTLLIFQFSPSIFFLTSICKVECGNEKFFGYLSPIQHWLSMIETQSSPIWPNFLGIWHCHRQNSKNMQIIRNQQQIFTVYFPSQKNVDNLNYSTSLENSRKIAGNQKLSLQGFTQIFFAHRQKNHKNPSKYFPRHLVMDKNKLFE